jgi:hypothetical protein
VGESGRPGVRVVVGWDGADARGLYEVVFVAIVTFVVVVGFGGDRLLVLGSMVVWHR